MEVVTECLLHVELKMTKKEAMNEEQTALAVKGKPKRLVCHFCQKPIKRECWKLAQQETSKEMESAMKSLSDSDVWDIVPLPTEKKAVGSKWVFKIKTGADGNIEQYKARLVAEGFTLQYGADYDETFSPVVRMETF